MPAPQAIQCCLAGGGGIVLHRGTLHAERSGFNLQKRPAEKGGCRASSGFHLSFLGLPTSFL